MADGSPSGTGATSTTVAPYDGTISMVATLLLEQLTVEHPAALADVPCWAGTLDAIPDEAYVSAVAEATLYDDDPSYDMADDAVPGITIAPFDADAAVLLDKTAEPVLQPEPEQPVESITADTVLAADVPEPLAAPALAPPDAPHVAPEHPDDPDAADAPLDEDAPYPLEDLAVDPDDPAA